MRSSIFGTADPDPLTGREIEAISLFADNDTQSLQIVGSVRLIVRCSYNSVVERENGLEVYIDWNEELGTDYAPTVAVRFDKLDVEQGSWGLSTDSMATFAPDVDLLIASMKSANRLVARVWRKDQTTQTAQWDVAGIRDAVRPVEDRCNPNWTPAPTLTPTAINTTVGAKRMQWNAAPPMRIDPEKSYTATFTMERGGTFEIKLFANNAPKTVNSFVFLAREGYYDGSTFHRVIPGFMAQGGDPTGTGDGWARLPVRQRVPS